MVMGGVTDGVTGGVIGGVIGGVTGGVTGGVIGGEALILKKALLEHLGSGLLEVKIKVCGPELLEGVQLQVSKTVVMLPLPEAKKQLPFKPPSKDCKEGLGQRVARSVRTVKIPPRSARSTGFGTTLVILM